MGTETGGNFLHVHSTFSVGDSAQSPDDIVRRVKELGGRSVTLTDHRTLLGVDPFMEAGRKYGVNTIPGVENEVLLPEGCAKLLSNGDPEREEALKKVRNHLVLVPYDYEGFQKISKATKAANTNIQYVKKKAYPCLTDEMLKDYFSGNTHVMATSACIQGPVAYILLWNYRIRERMHQYMQEKMEFHEGYEAYILAEKREADIKQALKDLGKRITAETKPLKKPFQNRVERWRLKKEAAEPDSKAFLKAAMELEMLEEQVEEAREKNKILLEEQKRLTAQRELFSAEKERNKNPYKSYMRVNRELSSLKSQLVDDKLVYQAARERLLELKDIFPYFYIELQYHQLEAEAYVMPLLLKLADDTDTPVIAANDAHITEATEQCVEARRLIRFNFFNKAETVSDADRELYIKSDEELAQALSKVVPADRVWEAIRNLGILEKCHVVFPTETHYPKVRGGKPFLEVIEDARQEKIRIGEWDAEHQERLEHEIQVIQSMGYVDYHMVVEHFCRIGRLMGMVPDNRRYEIYQHFPDLEEWIRKEGYNTGIGIGPGRGSAVGSLVCYLLGITNLDPLKYGLLFERFLNPERVTMPDIDTDIASGIRPILISYLRWYYGENAVCSIVTVNTYGARSSVELAGRDRADQLYGKKDKNSRSKYLHDVTYAVTELIPKGTGITLTECETDILPQIQGNAEKLLIWERAKLVENCVSATGVHAGGVIISDNDDVNEYVPLAWNDEKQVWVAQCDMVRAEEKGLLKMDLLGLNNLDIMNTCVHLIRERYGIRVDLNALPFEDDVFKNIYAAGNTNGVFQVESDGMKQMLQNFKPSCFEDIILLVAAYRPGPMQYLPDVIAVKNGKKKLSFRHPLLAPILSTTYGAVIYQEQVMQIFQDLAGYSLGAADLVRRAMSKKKTEKLIMEREAFIYGDVSRGIDGCIKRGVKEKTANKIFDEMVEFAKYAFNKSHAAAYSLVSYQTAWLKYHYPLEFLCSLFNCKPQDEFASVFSDCSSNKIRLLPPDINTSYYMFVIEGAAIRYGFMGIKGVGEADRTFIRDICNERKKGEFTSFTDFLSRMAQTDGTGKVTIPVELIKKLINVGAFDPLNDNREMLIETLEKASMISADNSAFIEALRNMSVKIIGKNRSYNMAQELSLMGTILSEHPLDGYRDDKVYGCIPISDLSEGKASVFGFIVDGTKTKTKNGRDMIRMKLHGKSGECTLIFLKDGYFRYSDSWQSYINKVVKVSGRANAQTIFCDWIRLLSPGSEKRYLDLFTLDLQKKAESISGLHKEKQDEDEVELLMMVNFYKSGKQLVAPLLVRRYCTKETAEEMQRKGINFTKG